LFGHRILVYMVHHVLDASSPPFSSLTIILISSGWLVPGYPISDVGFLHVARFGLLQNIR
jgi:hypothetical protein